MSWILFTSATLAQRMAGPEFTALKNAARGQGQTADQLLEGVVNRVVQEVRGRVAACTKNRLGHEGTIPDELEDAACAIALYRFISRLPGSKGLLDDQRTKNYENAQELLKDVAACKLGIVQPLSPAPPEAQASGTGVTLVNSRPRIAGRNQTEGLI